MSMERGWRLNGSFWSLQQHTHVHFVTAAILQIVKINVSVVVMVTAIKGKITRLLPKSIFSCVHTPYDNYKYRLDIQIQSALGNANS